MESGSNLKKQLGYILLVLILLLAAFLRIYGLDFQSLWNDELATLSMANYNTAADVINYGVAADVHPPLYYLLIHYIIKNFGDSEFLLRLPSAIAGILSVLAIFFLGKRLFSMRVGLLSAALTAVLWKPVAYSQDARVYSLLFLITIISLYFWYGIFMNISSGKKISAVEVFFYVISCIILEYIHYFGLFAVGIQFAGLLLLCPKLWKRILQITGIYLIIAIAYLPWLPVMFEHLMIKSIWIGKPKLTYIPGMFYDFFNMSSGLVLVVSIIIAYNIYKSRNDLKRLDSPLTLLLIWLFLPLALAYMKSLISTPVLTFRNLVISAPAAYLLFSKALTGIFTKPQNKTIFTLIAVISLLFQLITGMKYYSEPANEQFRESAEYLVSNYYKYPESEIISCAWESSYFEYYFHKSGFYGKCSLNICDSSDIPAFNKFLDTSQATYFWFLIGHRIPDKSLVNAIENWLKTIDSAGFIKTKAILYKKQMNNSR